VVEGKTYIDGPCEFTPDKDQFSVSSPAGIKNSYFAIVNMKAGEQSFWNEEAGASHAHPPSACCNGKALAGKTATRRSAPGTKP
jgi:hypothetical protein